MGFSAVAPNTASDILRASNDVKFQSSFVARKQSFSYLSKCISAGTSYSSQPLKSQILNKKNLTCCNVEHGSGDFFSEDLTELSAIHQNKRRDILISLASLLTLSNIPLAKADTILNDIMFEYLKDQINAYEFKFPVSTPNDDKKFSWVETRKPERYSSAAPLAPDARQRIVYERLDFSNNLFVSVSIGPPNKSFLNLKNESDVDRWQAINVARSVLADKSTARMSVEQRVAEIIIEDTSSEKIDGETYWYYEHLTQKSPTFSDNSVDIYRHALAVSAFRNGYIYSLNVSTLNSKWPQFEKIFREMVKSFKLTSVTNDYVPPWKDPWRFW